MTFGCIFLAWVNLNKWWLSDFIRSLPIVMKTGRIMKPSALMVGCRESYRPAGVLCGRHPHLIYVLGKLPLDQNQVSRTKRIGR